MGGEIAVIALNYDAQAEENRNTRHSNGQGGTGTQVERDEPLLTTFIPVLLCPVFLFQPI